MSHPKGIPCRLKNIVGQKFGRLTILERAGSNISEQSTWRVRCDCGTEKVVAGISMRNGAVVSCGCYNSDATSKRMKTHGCSKTPIRGSFVMMMRRCYDPSVQGFEWYGGRPTPVIVCERWKDNIKNFTDDMLASFLELRKKTGLKLSLDRKDVDGPYSPNNCRWATSKEQANNRTDNLLITIGGRTQTGAIWATEYGIPPWIIYSRIRIGWDHERAVVTPRRKQHFRMNPHEYVRKFPLKTKSEKR